MEPMKHLLFFRIITCLLLFVPTSEPAQSCTAFRLGNGSATLVGRNLDWPVSVGLVVVSPRGVQRTGIFTGTQRPARWAARFGSVTLSQFGNGLPLEGMNEEGLIVIELSLSISRYPANGSRPALNEFQLIQYLLDTCRTTDEAVDALETVDILPVLFRLQYFVCDRTGNTAVVQYLDGRCRIYTGDDLPVPVATNNRYDNMMRYLTNHRGFGGSRLVSNGPESPERFVRAATLLQGVPDRHEKSLETVMSIQDTVSQPDTAWRTVFDPVHRNLYVRMGREGTNNNVLHLDGLSFREGSPVLAVMIDRMGTDTLERWEPRMDRNLLGRVLSRLAEIGETVPAASRQLLLNPDR